MIGLGCHVFVPLTVATGSDPTVPFWSVNSVETCSRADGAPVLVTKNRIVGAFAVTQIAGLVAKLPAGSDSDVVSVLGSMPAVLLPVASAAPLLSVQPGAPFSNEPPGVR